MGKENKLHIILLGRTNSGKSSLINTLTGQRVAIVSDIAGTTTDPVKRSYEIPGFASVIFIDTAGVDDTGTLAPERIAKTRAAIALADIAILVISGNRFGEEERQLIAQFKREELPFLLLHNKRDETALAPSLRESLVREYGVPVIDFSTREEDSAPVIAAIREITPRDDDAARTLLGDLLSPGDIVLLVAPVDSEAPTGRLILPQVQTLRDILDHRGIAIVLQPEELASFLAHSPIRPRLVVTDSQAFREVANIVPPEIPLTSFSILFARHKGDFSAYLRGTPAIEHLREGDRVLLLESCSHHVSCEDIGRHKIPRWLQEYTGKNLLFDFIAGLDALPRPITDYAIVIQCGGCMITSRQLRNRLRPAIEANIPVSNYGMTIAYLHGIFHRATEVF